MWSYLQHLYDGRGLCNADLVPIKAELLDGSVFLSENESQDTVYQAQKWCEKSFCITLAQCNMSEAILGVLSIIP